MTTSNHSTEPNTSKQLLAKTLSQWERHPHAGVALAFMGLAMLFYAPVLLGLRTFPDGDFTHHFLPFSLFQQQELLAGRLPVWNPYTYSGHPFLADVQAAVFYPLSNLLLALTLPWTDPGVRLYFLQVEAVVQVALGGFFTALLLERLTGNRWAGVLAGICFAFSGYLTGYPPVQLAVLRTAIWLPLLLWLLLRVVSEPTAGAGRWAPGPWLLWPFSPAIRRRFCSSSMQQGPGCFC